MAGAADVRRDPAEVDALARADQLRNRPDGIAAALRGVGTGEMRPLWGRLGELTMPVEILVGERDTKFHAPGRRMAGCSPSTVTVVSGGHVLPLENPLAVSQAIG